MKKIYEAIGEEKRSLIEIDNSFRAHDRNCFEKDLIGISDYVMVGRTNSFPIDSKVNIHWSLNGLIKENRYLGEIIIIEPLEEQINNGNLEKIDEVCTSFNEPIELSDRAIILMNVEKYNEISKNPKLKNKIDEMNIRLYEGEEELAVKMIFLDKRYIYLEMTEKGYNLDNPDTKGYIETLLEKQKQIVEEAKMSQKGPSLIGQRYKAKKGTTHDKMNAIDGKAKNYRMITGLTNKQEVDIELDDELYASTDIGKTRENQEDALLLIKDKKIPDFKMLVVADGMGGWQSGEVASDIIVNKLRDWFENLSEEEKSCYYTSVDGLKTSLQEKIELDIQSAVESKTWHSGGSTLVCAIIGQKDTLIANIGDSRAYIIKNGKLEQLSREDTVAQENLERGKTPNKEGARFDSHSNELTQCIGMNRRELNFPHFKIINNNEYDMLLLFSDGVTDCLSEDDIAVVCKNSNRKEVTKNLVEKAIRHDSIQPDEFVDYENLNAYIPGGKDNTTAVAYVPKREEIEK